MKPIARTLGLAALAAVGALAQFPPMPPAASRSSQLPSSPGAVRRAAPAGATAKPAAAVPSVKDLKFPPLKPLPNPAATTFTLPNGMKVYLLEDRKLPLISGVARVRAGNLFDPAGKAGLAELTGISIRAGGTKSKTGAQWDEELENAAATVESHIDETSGAVSFSTLTENADAVMAIFKDALTAPEFAEDRVELAKAQYRGAIARRNDDARNLALREFLRVVYGKDTAYGGQAEYSTIAHIGRGDIQDFYRRYFFPRNAYLAVWGDFDAAAMRSRLERLFADWTVEQPAPPPFPEVRSKSDSGVYLALKKGLDRAYFSIGQLSGEVRDPDCPALEVMTAILGGGADSRLYQRLLTKMGDANAIAADWDANYGHPGAFRISGAVKSPSTVEDIRAIREEVERMRSAEVSAEELAAAKNTAINRLAFAYDTNAKAVGRMLGYAYFGYPEDFIQQYQKALAAVTAADVLRVAKEHLDPARFAIVVVGNPAEFLNPLSSLGGPVRQIDSTIPGAEAAPADAAGLAKGKQMIERAQQAVGGADKLAAIQDIAQVSEARPDSPPDAAPIQATELWLAPDAFRREQSAPTGKIVVYLNGRSGWASPPAGTAALTGVRLKEVEGDRFRLYFRLLLGDRMPGWTVNAIDDATLEIADGAGQIAQLTVDPASGMPRSVRYELVMASGPPLAMADTWSDFREAAGVKMPYKIVRARNGVKYAEFTVTDCKINSGLKLEDLRSRP